MPSVTLEMPLLERERELAALTSLIAGIAEGEGGAAIVDGPAGIGKTRLLRSAVAIAEAADVLPLVARSSELERGFPFGVARQLLETEVVSATPAERARLLADAARHAAPVLDVGTEEDLDRFAAIHGLYWLVANLAARRPLLLAVDDAQSADEASLQFLAYLCRRLDGLPVAVVLTVRAGERGDSREALDALGAEPGVLRLRPEALSADGAATLLGAALDEPSDAAFAEACRAHTVGNPFFLAELARELARAGVRPRADEVAAAGRLVPERVGEAMRARLEGLSPEAQALARALVVLGEETLPVVGAVADLDADAAADAAVELTAVDLVEAAERIRFRHPLVQSALEAELPLTERERTHARAARCLAAFGASERQVVAHLLASGGGDADPWAVERLRAAARSARAQGAAEEAVAELRRALAEPPPGEQRGGVLRELGEAELAAMLPEAAEHLEAALGETAETGARAEVALPLAVALHYADREAEAVDVLVAAVAELDDRPVHRELRLRLETYLAASPYWVGAAGSGRDRLRGLASRVAGETPAERFVRAVAAFDAPGETAEELARASGLLAAAASEWSWLHPAEEVESVLGYVHAGRPDVAGEVVSRMVSAARTAGSPARHAVAVGARGVVSADLGNLRDAEADLRTCTAMLLALGPAPIAPAVGYLVQVLVDKGSLAEAQDLFVEYDLDGELSELVFLNPVLFGRGMLRAAQGRPDVAAEDFLELGRRHGRWETRRPSPPWRSAAALALFAADEREQARELAAEELELARTWGTAKANAVALRACALIEEGEARLSMLMEAAGQLEGTPWQLEHARTLCDLGAALRAAGRRREAREALAAAMDEAHRCGAESLAERAADELRSTGARPRRRALRGVDALTPSEARVAELAASGRSNREIAQDLFVTLATVETHLTRVYRKVGVDGRERLAATLAAPESG
jgi:DNA-binding CsgD family transcriptional regulator